ncbi:MAG: primosomal protein N' [Thiothrix sp.]|nr:MAG: primosomal protein N' [Thiothrix sp.]
MIASVALPSAIANTFDYLPGKFSRSCLVPGVRVRINFAGRKLIGIVTGHKSHSDIAEEKLKPILEILDPHPILEPALLNLLHRAANYYHWPLGEVIITALPKLLRQGKAPSSTDRTVWIASDSTPPSDIPKLTRAPRQQACLNLFQSHPQGLDREQLKPLIENPAPLLKALVEKNLLTTEHRPCRPAINNQPFTDPPPLNPQQTQATKALQQQLGQFKVSLLEGVTGSGKTEVYLQLIKTVLESGKQVLILIPEISLTPQLTQRFKARFDGPVISLHSGLNDRERLCGWRLAGLGEARIIIGTRSAVFTPLKAPGLIILDEEHDPSLKQQEGFRYHARDLAILRAQMEGFPVVLGSATPSLESMNNAASGRYEHLKLTERAGDAQPPVLHIVDLRRQEIAEGLSRTLLDKMRVQLEAGHQVLLFLNRRGYAPVMLCHDCGQVLDCPRCDSHTTYHAYKNELRCHHCGHWSRPPPQCPQCNGHTLLPIGLGTQKIESVIQSCFPDEPLIRVDRDSMSRKNALPQALDEIARGDYRIIIGTQMLAKGHDFHNITLVGLIDVDQGLFSTDFRAPERMIQQILQVSGRAGRGKLAGEVVIQTHHPEHPLLQTLIKENYATLTDGMLEERRTGHWPPFSHIALLRASAFKGEQAEQFLQQVQQLCSQEALSSVEVLGPVSAAMERKAGRYRYQLLFRSVERKPLHILLKQILPTTRKLKLARKVRWSIDVDPMDMS